MLRSALLSLSLLASAFATSPAKPVTFEATVQRLERRHKVRIGVFALRGSRSLGHRSGERFAYCSTFKWVLGAAVLKEVEAGRLSLGQKVSYTAQDLLEPCELTRAHLAEGSMPIGELCAATIATSDNTAANLLEPRVGGPAGLQAFVRALGDPVTRFDRMEPELNSNRPGDPRDTSTPEAMARLLRTALGPDHLSPASRAQLLAWMKATTTGKQRIRAGVPPGWAVGNKTGTSGNGAVNDVAVIFPPEGEPLFLCIFTNGRGLDMKAREAAIAGVTRVVVKGLHH